LTDAERKRSKVKFQPLKNALSAQDMTAIGSLAKYAVDTSARLWWLRSHRETCDERGGQNSTVRCFA
jgi:hypothetical protein